MQGIKVDSDKVSQTIKHYGALTQHAVCLEELSELAKVVAKSLRYYPPKYNYLEHEDLIEEMADVLIMLKNLQLMYGVPSYEISEVIKQKQNRQLERMKKGANV